MKKKNTSDLHTELRNTKDLSLFLEQNANCFNEMDFSEKLEDLIASKGITKSSLAEHSGMSEVYLYQVLSRKRNPSRSRIICLCIGLGATLEETQDLLHSSGQAVLYPRSRSDAIIMYGIMNGMDLYNINELLFRQGEDTLM